MQYRRIRVAPASHKCRHAMEDRAVEIAKLPAQVQRKITLITKSGKTLMMPPTRNGIGK